MRKALLALALVLMPLPSLAADLDLWFPHDVDLTAVGTTTPYLIEDVTCTFTHATAASITVPGFWDGSTLWTCRMAPTATGLWSWTSTSATDTGLDGDSGSFTAVAGTLPGFIERDGSFDWKTSDATPYFMMGDTCWRCMIVDRMTDAEYTAYLAARDGQSFNIIRGYFSSQFRSAGDDDNSGTGITGGANASFTDADTPDPAYWQKIESRLAEANALGIAWNIVAGSDGNIYEAYFTTTARREKYITMLIGRFAAFNVMWDGLAEIEEHDGDAPASYTTIADHMLTFFETNDPYDHPRGTHTLNDTTEFNAETWLEFVSYQTTGENNTELITDRAENLPLLNEEFCYEEQCSAVAASSHTCTGDVTRDDGWAIVAGGGYAFAGHENSYMGGTRDHHACSLTDTSISDYEWLYKFWSVLPRKTMTPNNALTNNGGFSNAAVGSHYAVWNDTANTSFTVDLAAYGGKTFKTRWLNPADGAWTVAADTAGGSSPTFNKPAPTTGAWALALVETVTMTQGVDRHVLLDTTGTPDGILNDCPNPSHSIDGGSSNANLTYCLGGTHNGKVIGTRSGLVASATCTDASGVVTNVTNGVKIDYDGDGLIEEVWGHPQAAVWNMAKSDDVEVHAGVYTKSGSECNGYCGDTSTFGALNVCVGSSCWRASIVAMGYGPNLGSTGYGTLADPGIVRGALMGGVQDTWDADGDKRPDTCGAGLSCPAMHDDPDQTSWPAIMSGDADGDDVLREATACSGNYTDPNSPTSGNTCTGDSYFGVIVGCFWPDGEFCRPAANIQTDADAHPGAVDTDADGVVDAYLFPSNGEGNENSVSYLHFRHLAFTEYGPGNGETGGSRTFVATLNLNGRDTNGVAALTTDGLDLDTIAVYENAPGTVTGERTWSTLSTGSGGQLCTLPHEVKNSFFQWTNRRFYDNDCGGDSGDIHCGCPITFHDNIVEQNWIGAKPVGANLVAFYMKPFGRQGAAGPYVVYRFYNNDFFFTESDSVRMFDIGTQLHAESGIYWYGNIVRSANGTLDAVMDVQFADYNGHGTGATEKAFIVSFNNTFDVNASEFYPNPFTQKMFLGTNRNNAFFGSRNVTAATFDALTEREANIFCTEVTGAINVGCTLPGDITRGGWFTSGTAPTTAYLDYNAIYGPASGSPLENAGSCDLDGDGTNGFDYDGDGVNDTSWTDIAGNAVDCSGAGTVHVGAVMGAGAGAPAATSSVVYRGVTLRGVKP